MATPTSAALPLILDLSEKRGYRVFDPATDSLGAGDNTFQGVADGAVSIGSPVYPTATGASTLADARADAAATMCVVGIACNAAADTAALGIITTGHLTLTTGEWDAVIDGVAVGGLVKGETLFLSDVTAGGIIRSGDLPAGLANPDYLVPLGIAIDATTLNVLIEPGVRL